MLVVPNLKENDGVVNMIDDYDLTYLWYISDCVVLFVFAEYLWSQIFVQTLFLSLALLSVGQ